MSGLPQVVVNRQFGGLGLAGANDDAVSGLVIVGVATADVALGDIVKLYSSRKAELLGFTKAYDTANNVLVHHQISEFFRMSPGAELWLMVVAAASMEDILDKDNDHAAKLLKQADGAIKQLAVCVHTGVFADDVIPSIAKAQELIDSEYSKFRPVDILLEGVAFTGTAAAATDLRTQSARDVSVVIAQDKSVADANAAFVNYAAIGTALGALSAAFVHESIGYVRKCNIADVGQQKFLNPALSSNTAVADYSDDDLDTLNDKGYIFGRTFANYAGVYFSNSHTCIEITDDFRYIELNRTIKKAIRTTRTTLLPHLLGELIPDVNTGRLDTQQKATLETEVESALELSVGDSIASIDFVVVDPAKDENGDSYPDILLDNTLRVVIGLVPKGKADQIIATIGLVNPNL